MSLCQEYNEITDLWMQLKNPEKYYPIAHEEGVNVKRLIMHAVSQMKCTFAEYHTICYHQFCDLSRRNREIIKCLGKQTFEAFFAVYQSFDNNESGKLIEKYHALIRQLELDVNALEMMQHFGVNQTEPFFVEYIIHELKEIFEGIENPLKVV